MSKPKTTRYSKPVLGSDKQFKEFIKKTKKENKVKKKFTNPYGLYNPSEEINIKISNEITKLINSFLKQYKKLILKYPDCGLGFDTGIDEDIIKILSDAIYFQIEI